MAQPASVAGIDSTELASMATLRADLGFTRELFARLVNFSVRKIADIEKGKKVAPTSLRMFVEIKRLWEALAEIMEEDEVGPWLKRPCKAFSGRRPLELVEGGEIDEIWQLIYRLRSGEPI